MRKPLLNITTFSEKRKEVLLLLLEGNKMLEEIREKLNESSPSILPQIKILKEYRLVCQTKEGYHLTDIGRLVALELDKLNSTCEAMQKHQEYLITHESSSIPMHLLERIGELKEMELRTPKPAEAFDPYSVVVEELKKSKTIKTFVTIYHPAYPLIYADLLEKGVRIELVMGTDIFEKVKTDYPQLPFLFMGLENSNLYIYDNESGLSTIICTDRFVLVSLFTDKKTYDLSVLHSKDKRALKWGDDLFQYYLEKSTLVK
ncbi:putative transcriptional regulator [Methanohalophilus levihalophilus]|uniref:helix-turn-helix transcriptional regulator n=1 Tax=Methanohalophilus levihalophilus TaxID=1431282 RepID=UPI001AE4FA3E|nr:winged helix-turn-helix domain-containing protein [Methanohalophilus levihalophilus]MBP2029308.1 putative transcriptional regulator [Methanohalophilus levihalophilus]